MTDLILYHATPKKNVESIKQYGLRSAAYSRENPTLTDKEQGTWAFLTGDEQGNIDSVVLKFRLPPDAQQRFLFEPIVSNYIGPAKYSQERFGVLYGLRETLPAKYLVSIVEPNLRQVESWRRKYRVKNAKIEMKPKSSPVRIDRLKKIKVLLHQLDKVTSFRQLSSLEARLAILLHPLLKTNESVRDFLYANNTRSRRAALGREMTQRGLTRLPLLIEVSMNKQKIVRAERPTLSEFLDGRGNEIEQAFRHMFIAEKNIDEIIKKYPDRRDLLFNAFVFLPSDLLSGLSDDLFNWHSYELLERIATSKSIRVGGHTYTLEPATKAEIMAAISNITLKTPVKQNLSMVYQRLFNELFPQKYQEFFGERPPRESYPGEYQELLNEFAIRFRNPRRSMAALEARAHASVTKATKGKMPATKAIKSKTLLDYFK